MMDAKSFGKSRGWSFSNAPFSLETLSRRGVSGGSFYSQSSSFRQGIDHPDFHRVGRRAVAIASHPYLDYDNHGRGLVDAICAEFGMNAEWLGKDESWYRPGDTVLIIFTPSKQGIQK